MDDVFVEKLVTRKLGGKELAVKLGAIALVLVLGVVAFLVPVLQMVAPIILVGAGWLGWMAWSRSSVEYEYSLSNGELTIDGIFGQQKRKSVITVSLRERMEFMAPVSNDYSDELNRTVSKTMDVSSASNAPGRWFMNVKGESGLIRIFFEPDEKLASAMRRAAPSKVKGLTQG
ncbi:MAG: hypothetical protein RR185_05240 [Angelakisella sp.]